MAKPVYVLKSSKAQKPTAVILFYSCADGRLRYYTGQSVHPFEWIASAQTSTDKGVKAELNRITDLIEQAVVDSKIKGDPLTKQRLKQMLDNRKWRPSKASSNFFEDLTTLVNRMEEGRQLTPGKKKYSAGSIKTFRFTINFLRQFDPNMTADRITQETYFKFIHWCQEQDYSINYIGSQIKNWKSLGKAVGGNPIFDTPAFKKISEETYDVYLDEEELKAMHVLKLNGRESLVRDWFLLDCYTGLRVSDLVMLSNANYNNGFITIANKKTDETVVIPVHPYVKEIIDRYNGFPRVVSDIELNRTIKKVAKQAGINDRILFTITKGGRRQDTHFEKWEMVSCHTARRSFVTNLRKNGVPDSIVMKLTGIKSATTLKRYDKLTAPEAAKIAAELSFFKPIPATT